MFKLRIKLYNQEIPTFQLESLFFRVKNKTLVLFSLQEIWQPLPWFTFKLDKNTTAIQTDISKEVGASTREYLC